MSSEAKIYTLAEFGELIRAGRITLTFKKTESNEPNIYINVDNVPRKIRVQIGTDEVPCSMPFGLSALFVKEGVPSNTARRELSWQMTEDQLKVFDQFDAFLVDAIGKNAATWVPASKMEEWKTVSGGDATILGRLIKAAYKPFVTLPKESKYRPSVTTKFLLTDEEHRREYMALGGKPVDSSEDDKKGSRKPSTVLVWRGEYAVDPRTRQPIKGADGKFVKALHRGSRVDLTKGSGGLPIVDIEPLSFNQGKFKSSLIVDSVLVYPQAQVPSENFQIPGGFVIVNDRPDVLISGSDSATAPSAAAAVADVEETRAVNAKRSADAISAGSETPATSDSKRVKTEVDVDDIYNDSVAVGDQTPL